MIRGLNHLTLAVRDLDRAVAFYRDALGAEMARRWDRGAYLELGTMWLCLELDDRAVPARGDGHVAFDVAPDDFAAACARARGAGAEIWKADRSEGPSLYIRDPDGHLLELHVGSLASRLAASRARCA